jgi:hypothetical protein
VERDGAAVHRGRDRADQDTAASLSNLEERLIEPAAESAAALCRIYADKVDVGLAGPGLGDEPGQETG